MAVSDPDGRFVQVNAALRSLLGHDEPTLMGMRIDQVMHVDDVHRGREQRRAMLDGQLTQHQHETRFVRQDETVVGVLHSSSVIPGPDGRPQYVIDHIEDITGRKEFEARLQHLALHDPLTGLPNRSLLTRRLERLLAGERQGRPVALLFLDLDRFKKVNDSAGHLAGDVVLVECARRLETLLSPGDTLARLGGDEFIILLDDCSAEQARTRASAIATVLQSPFTVGDAEVQLSASIGISTQRSSETTAESLIADADAAMYSAKERGRARFEVLARGARALGASHSGSAAAG